MAASGIAAAVLVVLTAVFDNLMIAAGLFTYPAEHLSGLRIGLAPLEDFSYPLCAAFLVPAVFTLLDPAHRSGGDAHDATHRRLRPGAVVVRQLFVASRPVSWINTAYPFAAAYLLTTRQIDLDARDRHAVLPRARTTSRCTASTTCSTTSPTCAIPARAARTARCSIGGCTGSRCGRRRCRALPFVVYLVVVGIAGVVARAGREPVLRRLLQRAAAAAEGGAVRRLGDLQHPLLLPRGVRPRAGRRGLDLAAGRGDRRVRAVGRRLARVRRGAGCRRRPRSRHLVDRDGARRALDRVVRARVLRRRGARDAGHALAGPARRAGRRCRTSRRCGRSARVTDETAERGHARAGGGSSGSTSSPASR